MLGVEHFYLYDNSGAHPTGVSLQSIKDKFPPGVITVIDWPSQVCNNNPVSLRIYSWSSTESHVEL
jgi:hypothetical protein